MSRLIRAPRPLAVLAFIGAALIVTAGVLVADRLLERHQTQRAEVELTELKEKRAALHETFKVLIDRDTYLASALAESAEIVLALPEEIIHDLFHEITRSYFDRVELNLAPEHLEVNEDGEVRVKTFLGKMTAAKWKVHLDIHRLRGILSAGEAKVSVTGTNRIRMVVPARLQSGSGSATMRFHWDPKGLANLVCNEFTTTQSLSGSIVPRDYMLKGDFVLSAGEDNLMADPEFPPDRFVVSVQPSENTWAEVRKKLESQDKLFKCGLVFNPDNVVEKLKALGLEGFRVKLPRSLFRAVKLPASILKSVNVGTSVVRLSVRPNVLRVTPTTFWYSASVETETRTRGGPPVARPAAPVVAGTSSGNADPSGDGP